MPVVVDTRGKQCPIPLIMLRKAIKDNPKEKLFEVLANNQISCSNLQDFAKWICFSCNTQQPSYHTIIRIGTEGNELQVSPPAPTFAEDMPKGQYVVQLASDEMGTGPNELGELLLLSFLNALKSMDTLPAHIVCYNTGVKLTLPNTASAQVLQELEERGVQILVCGTCTNYFGITESVMVGRISNMYDILEALTKAHTVIRP